MQFNITVLDMPGFEFTHFLYDTVKLLNYGLSSLGHDCIIGRNNLDPGRLNVLVGGFQLRQAQEAAAIIDSGCRYIVLQTEIVGQDDLNQDGDRERFQRVFLPLMRGAASVWETVDANLPVLQQLEVKAVHLRPGYHPRMEEIAHKRDKDIDYLFYGSISEHRRQLLEALSQRGHRLVVVFDPVALYRNDLIARARINLSMRRAAKMSHLPSGRIVYLVTNGGLVVGERCDEEPFLHETFLHAETNDWVELCERTLERPDGVNLAEEFRDRLKTRPMTEHLEEALAASHGL